MKKREISDGSVACFVGDWSKNVPGKFAECSKKILQRRIGGISEIILGGVCLFTVEKFYGLFSCCSPTFIIYILGSLQLHFIYISNINIIIYKILLLI